MKTETYERFLGSQVRIIKETDMVRTLKGFYQVNNGNDLIGIVNCKAEVN